MRTARGCVWAVGCLFVLAAGAAASPPNIAAEVGHVAFRVEPSPAGEASLTACAEAVRLLASRGWNTDGMRVRIVSNPFDATRSSADLVLDARQPSETSAFELMAMIVERQLRPTTEPELARVLAETVAAHLSPPSSPARIEWERGWLDRLGHGGVLTTAFPEALWRSGADAAVRRAALGTWPQAALETLAANGSEAPVRAVAEVAVAGLLDPEVLGFHRLLIPDFAPDITQLDSEVRLPQAGMRIVKLQADTGAVAVLPVNSLGAEAWVAVRYALTGAFDVVPLNPVAEVTVPLAGVAWAGVIVVGLAPDARLSLAVRGVTDHPVQVESWDFVSGPSGVTLSWETLRHEGLQAFVVETLAQRSTGTWSVLKRTVVPVANDGDHRFGYTFVDEGTEKAAAYRLLALTSDGFLAEIGSFPLRNRE